MRYRIDDLIRFAEDGDLEEFAKCLKQAPDIDWAEESGNWTALFVACLWGRAEMVRLLIDAGADVNHSSDYGDTALMVAVEHQHQAIVEALLAAGANANNIGRFGMTPLHYATDDPSNDNAQYFHRKEPYPPEIRERKFAIITNSLNAGANPNHSGMRISPLMSVRQREDKEVEAI